MRSSALSINTVIQRKSILHKFCLQSKEPPTIDDIRSFIRCKEKNNTTFWSIRQQLGLVTKFLVEEYGWTQQMFNNIANGKPHYSSYCFTHKQKPNLT